ncbi:hypothetical protein P3T76_014417 [Phytophthora citrophthora]|uniref:Uncharacterized protein n=1 Tax=Phytophthora citrophthora TaxID=4793 RepID=A0AAD9G1E5_9STRA|nr:hypothetical protein P3T76_014417 [Phytophthora citrophthora]
MTKLFPFAVAITSFFFGRVSVTSMADTCVLVDFQTATSDFTALNNLISTFQSSPTLLTKYMTDSYVLTDKTLSSVDFSFFDYAFTMTPTAKTLNVSGITTLYPKPFNVTGPNTLDVGTSFTDTVSLDGAFSVEIAQPEREWYEICWVNLLDPWDCPSTTLTADVSLAIKKPVIVASVQTDIYQCAEGIETSVCSNLTMMSILVSFPNGSSDLSTIKDDIILRIKDASLTSLTLDWDSVVDIEFTIREAGDFISQLFNALLDYSADGLNEKGDYYWVFMKIFNQILKSLLNVLIDALDFGGTCMSS